MHLPHLLGLPTPGTLPWQWQVFNISVLQGHSLGHRHETHRAHSQEAGSAPKRKGAAGSEGAPGHRGIPEGGQAGLGPCDGNRMLLLLQADVRMWCSQGP